MNTAEQLLVESNKNIKKVLKQLCCISDQIGTLPDPVCCTTINVAEEIIGSGSGFYEEDTLVATIDITGATPEICAADFVSGSPHLRLTSDVDLDLNGLTFTPTDGVIDVTLGDLGFNTWCGQTVLVEVTPPPEPPGPSFEVFYAGNSSSEISNPPIETISEGGTINMDGTATLGPGSDSAIITFRLPSFDSRDVRHLYYIPDINMSLLSSVEDGADLIITALVRPQYDGYQFAIGDSVKVVNDTVDEIVVGFYTDIDPDALSADVDASTSRNIGNGFANAHVIIQFINTPTANYNVTFTKGGVSKHTIGNQSLQELNFDSIAIAGADKSFDTIIVEPTV